MEYQRRLPRHPDKQSGVALAVVLWFLAAMALLVAGIAAQARVDVRLAQAHVARAKAAAAGDGAIQLMMASRFAASNKAGQGSGAGVSSGRFALGDLEVEVQMLPASRLVDVLNLRPQLLVALFSQRGGLSEGDAQVIANNVLQFRAQSRPGQSEGQQERQTLSTPEDLLRVPGFNRALLDAIYDDINAVSGGRRGGVQSVDGFLSNLDALGRADTEQAAGAVSRNRISDDLFRVDAVIEYGGQRWLRRRWVKMVSGAGSDLPWHSVRIEAPRVLSVADDE